MTPNSSDTPGFLLPVSGAPLYDAALDEFIHNLIVGLTGLRGDLVRPAWLAEPGPWPERDTNWIAFAVRDFNPDVYGVELHDPQGNGSDELQRHETIEVLVSALGPTPAAILSVFRDGLQIQQNQSALVAAGMGIQETGRMTRVPSLAKDKWLDRYDMPFLFRRAIGRTYQVFNLVSASGVIRTETANVSINVSP